MSIFDDLKNSGVYNPDTGDLDLDKAQQYIQGKRGNLNIILMGSTGVGKSTLINAIFGKELAQSGTGTPITSRLTKYKSDKKGLVLWDTQGIEAKNYDGTHGKLKQDIEKAFEKAKVSLDHKEMPHVAWLCIKEGSGRFQDSDMELLELAKEFNLPTIIVFTDTQYEKGNEFVEKVQNEILADYKDFLKDRFVRVNSMEYPISGHTIKQSGLEELLMKTEDCLAEVDKNSAQKIYLFREAQILDKQKKFESMIDEAEEAVHWYSGGAATSAAIPIPLSDAPLIAAAQGAMIYHLNTIFQVDKETNNTTSVVFKILGMTGVAQIGKSIVAGILKLIPGVGTVAGGVIRAGTAAAITEAIGHGYIAVLKNYYDMEAGRTILPQQTAKIMEVFKGAYNPPKE
ncbi:GTP-binding protein [Helicobacter pylori]